ncbi:hypothetical protein LXL04_015943 [Taraxacum kok-saghyz]
MSIFVSLLVDFMRPVYVFSIRRYLYYYIKEIENLLIYKLLTIYIYREHKIDSKEFEEEGEKKKDVKEDKNQKKKCTTAMAGNGAFASTWTHVYPIQEYNQEMQPMLDMLDVQYCHLDTERRSYGFKGTFMLAGSNPKYNRCRGCIEKEKGIDGVFHRRRGAAPVKGLAVIRVLREGERRVDDI